MHTARNSLIKLNESIANFSQHSSRRKSQTSNTSTSKRVQTESDEVNYAQLANKIYSMEADELNDLLMDI